MTNNKVARVNNSNRKYRFISTPLLSERLRKSFLADKKIKEGASFVFIVGENCADNYSAMKEAAQAQNSTCLPSLLTAAGYVDIRRMACASLLKKKFGLN
jgi:hydroxyethylthiazole kinase-like sugar kinase family protein